MRDQAVQGAWGNPFVLGTMLGLLSTHEVGQEVMRQAIMNAPHLHSMQGSVLLLKNLEGLLTPEKRGNRLVTPEICAQV